MIKVVCIETNKHQYTKKEIKKGVIYLTYPNYFYSTWDIIPIFENEDSENLFSTFFKKYFISLEEWREQRISKILEND